MWASGCLAFLAILVTSCPQVGSWVYFFKVIFGCAGSLLLRAGFSLALVSRGCSRVAVHELLMAAVSSVVGAASRLSGFSSLLHGLSCPAACGLFWDQGLNLCPLNWQTDP